MRQSWTFVSKGSTISIPDAKPQNSFRNKEELSCRRTGSDCWGQTAYSESGTGVTTVVRQLSRCNNYSKTAEQRRAVGNYSIVEQYYCR